MKALVLEKYNELVYKNVPDPLLKNNDVLVKVMACGICGSDVHGLDGSTGRRIPPMIMGHEASGVIVKTGVDVIGWKSGDRVTFDSTVYPLNDWFTLEGMYNLSDNREVIGVSPGAYKRDGAFAEFIAIPQHILYKIPEDVSFEQAAIAGAVHTFISTDENLEEKIFALTNNRGTDIAFEAVGIGKSVNIAIDMSRKGGKIVLVGNLSAKIDFPLQKVVTRELKVLGSCAIRGEYETVLNLIETGKIKVDDQISAVAPLSEGALWFKKLYNKEDGLNKVILIP